MILTINKYLIKFSFLIVLFLATKLVAQEERGYLSFKGETRLNDNHLYNAQIKVFRNGKLFTQTTSSRKGKFEIKLEYFHQYKVELFYSGCYKMFIDVNTDIPRDLLPHWATFVIKIPFFNEKDTSVDASLFKQSITNVLFDESKKKFTDQHQFKTNSPANVNIPFISTKNINESPVKINNAEKKEVFKQDAKENIAIKRKEETALIKKVKSNHRGIEKQNESHNRKEWNSTLQKNNILEKNYSFKKESKNNLIITESKTADLFKKKAASKSPKRIETKIVKEEDNGFIENRFITKVFKNNVLFISFTLKENTFTGNSFYINNKQVSSTEYYLKIKQYIK